VRQTDWQAQPVKLKAATMSEVRQQLLITLVHGTWPRGLFPGFVLFKQRVRELARRQHRGPPPFWFEEGSPFLGRLGAELGDIPHKITPLLWSGANSIFVRDKTAHALAEQLSAEQAQHPEATQLVIAHSHGGNVALRGLHHLKQRNTSPSCAESANPLVVTLATPFIEVHPADFGRKPYFIRAAVLVAVWLPLWTFEKADNLILWIFVVLASLLLLFLWWYWTSHRAPARQNKVRALSDATRSSEIALLHNPRLLIIRAVDDEASLSLAVGTIGNYFTGRAIAYLFYIVGLLPGIILLVFVTQAEMRELLGWKVSWIGVAGTVDWLRITIISVCSPLIFILIGVLMAARSVHGRELAVSPMECQINTQSTPDAIGLSKVVTLVRRTFVKSLRHGIYDHDDCAKMISDWARSQLTEHRAS
jgi:hypothetical protein